MASPTGRLPAAYEAIDATVRSGLRAFSHALNEEVCGVGVRASTVSPEPGDTRVLTNETDGSTNQSSMAALNPS